MAKLKKKSITAKQKSARRMNIEIARRSKKKAKTRFGNAVTEKKKTVVMVEKKKGAVKKAIQKKKNFAAKRTEKKKLSSKATIKQASKALASRGYSLGRGKTNLKTMTTSYMVKSKFGKSKSMTVKEIIKMING